MVFHILDGKNLALGKPAWQMHTSYSGYAQYAVDGNPDPYYYNNSCSHTGYSDFAWWIVDLQSQYKITRVSITNRDSGK